jgi:hypothetical protein
MQISTYFVRFRTRISPRTSGVERRYSKDGAFFTQAAYLPPLRDPRRINPPNFPEADF